MKNYLRIITLFTIIALYSFTISFNSGFSFYANHRQTTETNSSTEHQHSLLKECILNHTAPGENVVGIVNTILPASTKNTFTNFAALNKITELLLKHKFLQYSFYANHLSISLSRADIIFPFHYFW